MAGLTLQSVQPWADRCFTGRSHYSILPIISLMMMMITLVWMVINDDGEDDLIMKSVMIRDRCFWLILIWDHVEGGGVRLCVLKCIYSGIMFFCMFIWSNITSIQIHPLSNWPWSLNFGELPSGKVRVWFANAANNRKFNWRWQKPGKLTNMTTRQKIPNNTVTNWFHQFL